MISRPKRAADNTRKELRIKKKQNLVKEDFKKLTKLEIHKERKTTFSAT